MTDSCRVCTADFPGPGLYLELEYYPHDGDAAAPDRLTGQLCDDCADWLAGEILCEQAMNERVVDLAEVYGEADP